MKDIMLKITGSQFSEGSEDEDKIEFITEGSLEEVDDAIWLRYPESDLSGLEGCTTCLKILGQRVEMHRTGDAVPIDTEMFFEQGKRMKGFYETPYGAIEMEVLTNRVDNRICAAEGKGSLNIDYHISLRGLAEGRNRLDIEILEN